LLAARRSISSIIRSAHRMESAMALTVAGTRAPLSYCANFRAARACGDQQHALPTLVHEGKHITKFRLVFALKPC